MPLEQNAENLINYLENKPSRNQIAEIKPKNPGRTDSKTKTGILQQQYAMRVENLY